MKKWVYYNEYNSESAAMLRQMIKDGLIPHGYVDKNGLYFNYVLQYNKG